jgi:hypothetical protein
MSSSPLRFWASLLGIGLAVLGLPGAAAAQRLPPITIEQAQVGFGSSPPLALYKAGFWTPLYFDLDAWPDGPVPEGELIIEANDSDDVRNRYTVRLPALQPKEHFVGLTGYTRPSGMDSDITVTVRIDGRVVARKSLDSGMTSPISPPLMAHEHLYLALGSGMANLKEALRPPRQRNPNLPEDQQEADSRDTGPRHVATIEDVRLVPNRWFAYEPVDLMVLPTGSREGFLMALLSEREDRKKAIAEWVRRGGHLIVSVGRNQDVLKDPLFEPIESLLPVKLTGSKEVPRLLLPASDKPMENSMPAENAGKRPPFEIAQFEAKPGRAYETLLKDRDEKLPVVVRGPYGMGQVTVVAFDVDQRPFTSWDAGSRAAFWEYLLAQTAPPKPTEQSAQYGPGMPGRQDTSDLATQLETRLEDFEDVPVISFGWVALFILIYILIVGPLDYLFLKKVVKRLELTWITFPTVVITISVAAYFTAYWIKGNDQKINKVDLLDVDLQTQQVYGNSWFTIFSPRIQHYTIGLEPATPAWVPAPAAGKPAPSPVLTYLGRPEDIPGGSNRAQSQGLFRRAYDYASDAIGLKGVPIQVWSTKSFSTAWEAPLDATCPLISSDVRLVRTGNKERLAGAITSHLPVELADVSLFYKEKWYSIGPLSPNVPYAVQDEKLPTNPIPMLPDQWLTAAPPSMTKPQGVPGTRSPRSGSTPLTITTLKKLLFYRGAGERNNALRYLDENWRLKHEGDMNVEEIILFGHVARQEGLAEDITASQANPTQLWLGALPAEGGQRPPLNGTLNQETYIRVMIPVPKVIAK